MKLSFLVLCLLICFLSACTQSKSIQKAYAFSQHVTFGTIATDDKGNPLTPGSQTNRFIYLEVKDTAELKITELTYRGNAYKNFSLVSAGNQPVVIGIDNITSQKIIITPEKGNTLWRIELSPADIKNDSTSSSNAITIKGLMNGKAFTSSISNEVELKPFEGL